MLELMEDLRSLSPRHLVVFQGRAVLEVPRSRITPEGLREVLRQSALAGEEALAAGNLSLAEVFQQHVSRLEPEIYRLEAEEAMSPKVRAPIPRRRRAPIRD